MPGPALRAERALPGEHGWTALVRLLQHAGLPTGDLQDGTPRLWVVRDAAVDVVGSFGLQCLGDEALLRSVCVRPDRRGEGLGTAIVALAEAQARARGVRRLVLLTESAERFFARLGYLRTDRAGVSAPMRRTRQFATVCPASAACMAKTLVEAGTIAGTPGRER